MIGMKTLILLVACALALLSCTDDPTDPAAGSTGVLEGTIEVYDAHLQRVVDASGVLVRFYDTEGKKFETKTNADGFWEIPLPFGVYMLDTMQHPTHIQLQPGNGVSSYGPKYPIDWLGKGRREFQWKTQFCPEPLQEIVRIKTHTIAIDSTFTPEHTTDGHYYPAKYLVAVQYTCIIENSVLGQNSMKCQLQTTSGEILKGSFVNVRTDRTTQDVKLTVIGEVSNFTELDDALLIVDVESLISQWFWIPNASSSGGWSIAYRQLSVPHASMEYRVK
jgi:hypothetical protein